MIGFKIEFVVDNEVVFILVLSGFFVSGIVLLCLFVNFGIVGVVVVGGLVVMGLIMFKNMNIFYEYCEKIFKLMINVLIKEIIIIVL